MKLSKKYVGEYRLANGFSITISVEENKLYALAQGDAQKIELTPESDTKFFLKGPETEIEFLRESGSPPANRGLDLDPFFYLKTERFE